MRDKMLAELAALRQTKDITAVAALRATGKAQRKTVPIAQLATPPSRPRDAVAFIAAIERRLIPELLPQRHAKMLASPAAFFRGTAELMAYDLSHGSQSGIRVLTDGDAHLQNFGFYASPERNLLFDLNDFDEAAPNSFEFDVKRLLTSTYLLGASAHYDEAEMDALVQDAAKTYRKTLKHAFKQPALTRFYASTNVDTLMQGLPGPDNAALIAQIKHKAEKRDHESVVKKYTVTTASGQLRFKDSAPTTVHVAADTEVALMQALVRYQQTTRPDTALLLSQYRVTDIVRHSVGIGSFGTNCYLVLLTGLGDSHLVLQVKEALPRRRELGPDRLTITQQLEASEGQRIIAATQILQKASDPFLGWFNLGDKSFYVRQFRDMKESIDVTELSQPQFSAYARLCSYLLALAHAQSPLGAVAAGYLNKAFDEAVQTWAKAYLHQVVADFAAFAERYGTA
ncbi:DUF2252 domain-containing protein [Lacticaseibacillus nasuensis]|nr:DUF2252 domain-containing protein [Lacticaseibacillus nasuensis]